MNAIDVLSQRIAPKYTLDLRIATGDALAVQRYAIRERFSGLFRVTAVAYALDQSIDFDAVVGRPATFSVQATATTVRTVRGVCSHIDLTDTAPNGVGVYQIEIVPRLWLATQRRNYRTFQQMADPDIVVALLGEWDIDHRLEIDAPAYRKRKYRVQYGESDYTFIARLLEDAGIAYYFDAAGVMVLTDAPEAREEREPIRYNHDVEGMSIATQVTNVQLGRRVRSGKYTIRDHDYRRPAAFTLEGEASGEDASVEAHLERYHYIPGAFLFGSEHGADTPTADDRGKSRHDPEEGQRIAARRLEAKRGSASFIAFETTAFDVAVGDVLTILEHPHDVLSTAVLVTETSFIGTPREWQLTCEATSTATPHRPALVTPKPKVQGVESATVVGPAGQEIHTDEFGRVRVQFHWDREGTHDERSSCWIHVSQSWAGATFGAVNLPRVGQEVLVDFLGGDPDRPVVVGRVYTNLQRVPYPLPENKTKSGWRSQSTPGGDGFNEIMFEDRKGAELFSMHAERDMATVVEHDQSLDVVGERKKFVGGSEHATVGASRTEQIGDDESLQVGRDRNRQVGGDETVNIGGSRVRNVVADDTLTVGGTVTRVYADRWSTVRGDAITTVRHDVEETILHDRHRLVANDETFVVGGDLVGSVAGNTITRVDQATALVVGASATREVGGADTLTVGGAQHTDVGESCNVRVGAEHVLEIGTSSIETVGQAKSTTVAGACSLAVGAALAQTVGGASTETVGTTKDVVAGKAVQLQAGVEPRGDLDGAIAMLRLQDNGEVVLGATSLDLTSAILHVEGVGTERALTIRFGAAAIQLRADGRVALTGTSLAFNGQPVPGAI